MRLRISSHLFVFAVVSFAIMGLAGFFTKVAFTLMLMATHHPPAFTRGLLYPRDSETREVRCLDGMWNFIASDPRHPAKGIEEKWYERDLSKAGPTIPMPVPASYNDVTTNSSLRDHIGTVWYDRRFFVPQSWIDKTVWIRFSSVHYEAIVWINGNRALRHEVGHLPFEADITSFLNYGQENRVTVLVDNVLIQTTVPQGNVLEMPTDFGMTLVQQYTFDFFNYAGIHRSVHLYTTSKIHIEDVIVSTDIDEETGIINYKIMANDTDDDSLVAFVQICDADDNVVATNTTPVNEQASIEIRNVKPWWPYLMHPQPGYLYKMEVFLSTSTEKNIDIYRLKVGIRTISWNTTSFHINGKPMYLRGFGRHEDSDIRGKGLDLALLTRDYDLLHWIGANAYRTSHYPYSEEAMEFADEAGIMIIDECPSVDTTNFNEALLTKHKSSIEQLIHRDKNHPSVIMWSIANEPRTAELSADSYFENVAKFTRMLDPTRPVSAAIAVPLQNDRAAKHMDILMFNRYNGWYSNPGELNMISSRVIEEATAWHMKHQKPVIMSEYGADTVEGLHLLPPFVWTEDYQVELFSRHFKAFDVLRSRGFFVGEFIWNFADFKTAQTVTRVGGNKKGVFTRSRQPKAVAHHVRRRYFKLANDLDNAPVPEDLFPYLSDSGSSCKFGRDEL
uniref:Beta-glucuronidase n=4 Tax=Lutzomyia longipalpis TaxID=7200 RepID=A0A1B0CV53_LUTLO